MATDYTAAIVKLEKSIRAELERKILPGVALALIDDQRIVHVAGYGFADVKLNKPVAPDTLFRAGSISKLFNAVAVMQLVERGRLDLDAPIQKYDPQFRMTNPFPGTAITLRQLLCHRSGMIRESPIGGYFDGTNPGLEATVRSVDQCVLVNPPQTKTRYSNVGPSIAGFIVALQAGRSFEDYQRDHILRPLGMKDSSFVLSDAVRAKLAAGYMRFARSDGSFKEGEAPQFDLGTLPAGNLYVSAADLAQFVKMIFAGGNPILKSESLTEMFKVQCGGDKGSFGLGFATGVFADLPVVSHNGAVYGFSASMTAIPSKKLGVVVLANQDIAAGAVKAIHDAAMWALLETKEGMNPPAAPQAIQLTAAQIDALVGDYESGGYWAKIEIKNGKLHLNISSQPLELTALQPLRCLADGAFSHRAPVVFTADASGKAAGFTAMNQRFQRVPDSPPPAPESWKPLLGVYGPDFIPLIVSIRHGRLYAMTENMVDYRLTPVNRQVFALPAGMYADEHLVFNFDPAGNVVGANLANMILRRISGGR